LTSFKRSRRFERGFRGRHVAMAMNLSSRAPAVRAKLYFDDASLDIDFARSRD